MGTTMEIREKSCSSGCNQRGSTRGKHLVISFQFRCFRPYRSIVGVRALVERPKSSADRGALLSALDSELKKKISATKAPSG
jgi:hypothetical protein